MEAASKKRGRPRVIPEDVSWLIASTAKPGCTARSRQDTYYRLHAMAMLKDVSGCEWVLPSKDEPDKWKPGILSELGRLLCVGGILAAQNAARHICETKPTTKRAIAIIREARLRRAPQGTAEGAEAAIIRAMNNYRDTHPGTTLAQLREALNEAYSIVEDMIDEKGS